MKASEAGSVAFVLVTTAGNQWKLTKTGCLSMLVSTLKSEVVAMLKGFVRSVVIVVAVIGFGLASSVGQTPAAAPAVVTTPEVMNFSALTEQAKALVAQAKAGTGLAELRLSQYRGHYTMLVARTGNGVGELHQHFADFLFVLDGEGTELTGGTMVAGKETDPGEIRGTKVEGATAHPLHKGDVIHIPAGTPHQALVAPGHTLSIFVVKVVEPN